VFNFSSTVFALTDKGCGNDVNKKINDCYMKKQLLQYRRKQFKHTPSDILCKMKIMYDKVHLPGVQKIKNIRTNSIYEQLNKIFLFPVEFNRPDILNRELQGLSIPLFTDKEIAKLTSQRIVLSNDCLGRNDYNFKLYANRIGEANNIPCSRLFLPAKTHRIHQNKSHVLECSFDNQHNQELFKDMYLHSSY
jgi:hypothetical protein